MGHESAGLVKAFAGSPGARPCPAGEEFSPRLASAAQQGEGKGEGHEYVARQETFAGKRMLSPLPTHQRMNQSAPVLPLILAFSPAPLTLRRGEGKRHVCSGLARSETRPVSPLPKILK